MKNLSIKQTGKLLLFLSASILSLHTLSQCREDSVQTLPERNWDLVWSEEFNGNANTSPDAAKWNFDIGTGNGGWGNQELEYYTNRTENVYLNGKGSLIIKAIKENYSGSAFTSGRIQTHKKFSQKYGKIEARIKTPYGPGIWPAFWMLGENSDTVSWPQCGEIDIMELRGQQPNIVHGTVHGPGYSAGGSVTKSYGLENGRFDTDFHVFAVEWKENQIDFFVDNFLYQRITPKDVTGEWVFNHDFFLILNVAVGGNFVGFPTTNTPFPQNMEVDYVRVYNLKS